MTTDCRSDTREAPILLAIAIAARKTGDRDLEIRARRELEAQHGITIRISRRRKEATHAD